MKFFSKNRTNNRLNGPLPIDRETGLYSRNFFLLRLREERERTKRTGSPFSLLLADIVGMSRAFNGNTSRSSLVKQEELVGHLTTHARRIDIKGWFDEGRVGVIMPETQGSGAKEFKGKLCQQIRGNWPGTKGVNPEDFVQVYTFSSDSPDRNGSSTNGTNAGSDEDNRANNPLYADIFSTELFSVMTRSLKRGIDIIGAASGILLTSPLMLTIAALIKLTSPGPVLFRQERIGFLGKRFVFLKFRSMTANVDQGVHEQYITELINGHHEKINRGSEGRPLYKMTDDARVTTIGRVLRKTSLDELPQLFNIVKGDMSLVGPRPPIPYEAEKYRLWHSARVFEVKPGLTGLWQVSGRSQTSFDDMVRLDLRYAMTWSLWLDFKIILKTFPAILSAKGAY